MMKYFQFDWTATRKQFWLFILSIVGLGFLAGIVGIATQPDLGPHETPIAVGLLQIALIIPGISMYKARLNDAGWSGWWQLFPVLNIVVAGFFASKDEDNPYKNG